MPPYLTPGVYVERIAAHPGSIEGVRSSTAASVDGFAEPVASECEARDLLTGALLAGIVATSAATSRRT